MGNSLKKKHRKNCRKARHTISETKLTGKIEKTKLKIKNREKLEIEKEEFKPLEVINKLELAEENKGQCEII